MTIESPPYVFKPPKRLPWRHAKIRQEDVPCARSAGVWMRILTGKKGEMSGVIVDRWQWLKIRVPNDPPIMVIFSWKPSIWSINNFEPYPHNDINSSS